MSEQNKIDEIKEALAAATPDWYDNGNEIVSKQNLRVGIGGFLKEEDNHLAANAPEYITYLLAEIERKDEALRGIKSLIPLMQEDLESPSLRHNTGNMIMHKVDQALREAL